MPQRRFPGLILLTALAVLLLPAWALAANPVYVPLGDANRIARLDGAGTRIDTLSVVPRGAAANCASGPGGAIRNHQSGELP